ncbi:MAG TPA: hypothetical protein PKE30_15250, partial [Niabella sp.]|nr:hypothetical protein [Niabella sp.]
MSQEVLKNFYADDTRCLQIADRLSLPRFLTNTPQKEEVALTGLFGSAAPFVFATSAGQAPDFNHIIVLNEAEDAAYFHNTLE